MSEVIKALKQARKDLEHLQQQITIIENFLDPFTVAELENQEEEN